jgi:predicted nucleic acid-binding protein
MGMERDSIYIETSIVSYLAARRSRNLVAAAWQETTWEFWERHRTAYDLYTSELVVEEASVGDPDAVERRLGFLRGIPELPVDDQVRHLAAALLADGAIPPKAEFDALHIAVAAVNSVTLLLTWNCRHLDNPATKPGVRAVCARLGYQCPEICTPLELTEGRPDEG